MKLKKGTKAYNRYRRALKRRRKAIKQREFSERLRDTRIKRFKDAVAMILFGALVISIIATMFYFFCMIVYYIIMYFIAHNAG